MTEKIAIFLNGEYSNNLTQIKKIVKDRKIIAVDGGTNLVYKLDLVPFKIIGDMDSIDVKILNYYKSKNVEIINLIKEKDYTDFEISLFNYIPNQTDRFKKKRIKNNDFSHLDNSDIMVLGATGNRIDMTLSNLKKLHNVENMYFITHNFETIKYINKSTEILNLKGKTFSIIPITNIKKMRLEGFKYKLDNVDIEKEISLASNIVENNKATISFEKGEMYIIYF